MNQTVSNPGLLRAVKEARRDRAKEYGLAVELKKARFLCPGKANLKNPTQAALLSLPDKSGSQYLMAFTGWDELNKWDGRRQQQVLALYMKDLESILLTGGSPYGIKF